jgi:pyruvate/2-oxoglutarate dehydrogenase complex dihydrolipoamide acyltransferase (E2) component
MNATTTALVRWLAVGGLFAMLGACGDKSNADAQASASAAAATAKPTAAVSASAAPSASASAAAAPALPEDWIDLDLTPAGKVWADYTLKGPKDAKVKKGFPDPTIEAGDFALVLSMTHTKKTTANLDTAKAYGVSWRALTDTEELFEYETSGEQNGEKFVRVNFNSFPKVDGKPIGCGGLNNQKERPQLAQMMAACRTLRKK